MTSLYVIALLVLPLVSAFPEGFSFDNEVHGPFHFDHQPVQTVSHDERESSGRSLADCEGLCTFNNANTIQVVNNGDQTMAVYLSLNPLNSVNAVVSAVDTNGVVYNDDLSFFIIAPPGYNANAAKFGSKDPQLAWSYYWAGQVMVTDSTWESPDYPLKFRLHYKNYGEIALQAHWQHPNSVSLKVDVDGKELFEVFETDPDWQDMYVITMTEAEQSHFPAIYSMPAYQFWFTLGDTNAEHDTSAKYTLPYCGQHLVSQGYFGEFSHQDCHCLDILTPEGTTILAARGGVVIDVVSENHLSAVDVCPNNPLECTIEGSDPNFVKIKHDDHSEAWYLHLKKDGATVAVGDRVELGDRIGYAGNTGYSTQAHLHFVVGYWRWDEPKWRSVETRFFGDKIGKTGTVLEQGDNYDQPCVDGRMAVAEQSSTTAESSTADSSSNATSTADSSSNATSATGSSSNASSTADSSSNTDGDSSTTDGSPTDTQIHNGGAGPSHKSSSETVIPFATLLFASLLVAISVSWRQAIY